MTLLSPCMSRFAYDNIQRVLDNERIEQKSNPNDRGRGRHPVREALLCHGGTRENGKASSSGLEGITSRIEEDQLGFPYDKNEIPTIRTGENAFCRFWLHE